MQKSPRASLLTLLFIIFSSSLIAQQVGSEVWSANVYPNPSNGLISISLTGIHDELTHINIVDASGKSVYTENVFNDRIHTIDLSSIQKGIYTIFMMSTNVYMRQPLVIM